MSDDTKLAPGIRIVIAHRLVQFGLLLTLVWKCPFFGQGIRIYARIPLDDPFFPYWLRSNYSVSIAYLGAVFAIALSLITASRSQQRFSAWLTFLGTAVLCIHQGSYNDMTFVTAWWTSVWVLWYVYQDWGGDDGNRVLRRAAFLSRLILSVILLGGAAGKWTGEYWSGEVFYDIYFRDRDFWLFNLLRANFEADTLREISKWYSRNVILVETIAGLGLWLLPPAWAAIAGITVFTSVAILSNWYLFSVVSCLIALAAVGLIVPGRKPLP